ncbi:MAG TPA: nuclear transport factor 2 family protein, partial [Candidatus Thermoplasmatota archaeon]|nr:nuclear transport factor 2 family protein [Candidatus Thermoplasmatota archaeon]
ASARVSDLRPVDALVDALCARDYGALGALLRPDARLRALAPEGLVEEPGRERVVARFRAWYDDATRLEVLEARAEPFHGRAFAAWSFRLHGRDGLPRRVAQRAFLDVRGGLVARVDVLGSGLLDEAREGDAAAPDARASGCGRAARRTWRP